MDYSLYLLPQNHHMSEDLDLILDPYEMTHPGIAGERLLGEKN